MADNYGPFDAAGASPGSWAQAQWFAHAPSYAPSGVIGAVASSASVGALGLTFSGLTGTLAAGNANVRGGGFERDTAAAFAVAANTNATLSRRDRVVLRRDLSAKTVAVTQVQGSPSSTPTAPALQRSDTGQWDLPLFSYLVPPNSGTGISGIIDERAWVGLSASRPLSVYDSDGTKGPMLALSSSSDLPNGSEVWEVSGGRKWLWDGTRWTWARLAGELAYQSSTAQFGPASSLGTWVPVPALAVGLTLPCARKVRLTWSGQVFSDQAGTEVLVRINNTTNNHWKPFTAVISYNNYGVGTAIVMRDSLAAGTYNVQIEIMRLAGPGNAYLTSDLAELLVEDIGAA